MTRFLIRKFVPDAEDVSSPAVRTAYGTCSSSVGVFCNVLLFILKLVMGLFSHSMAVIADAFNNLSDAGSSIISFLGFRIASLPADRRHPFGHGRMEYLCGLVISFLILLVGFDFVKSSIGRIIHPEPVVFGWITLAALLFSIGIKLWLAHFNRTIAEKIDSAAIAASAKDCISDTMATAVTLLSVILSQFTDFPVDGVMGLLVSGVILYAGFSSAVETISPLLGQAPDPKFVGELSTALRSYDGIIGVHDLIVHDYGPGRTFVSAHAEVPAHTDILKSHEVIDLAERQLSDRFGIHMLLHMDPIDTDCPETRQLYLMTKELVRQMDSVFTIHDFRVVPGENDTNLIFDLLVPMEEPSSDEDLQARLAARISDINPGFHAVITVDRSYTDLSQMRK